METMVKSNKSLTSYLLIAGSSSLAAFAAISFIFHISPHDILEKMADFSKHHYFSTGIFCLLSAVVLFKLYLLSLDVRDKNKFSFSRVGSRRSARRQAMAIVRNMQHTVSKVNSSEPTSFVDKAHIASMEFESPEVLQTKEEQEQRRELLLKALKLGNLYRQKVIICFIHEGLKKYTITTIWHCDDFFITLKGGVLIPVKCIYKVEL